MVELCDEDKGNFVQVELKFMICCDILTYKVTTFKT